METKRMTTQRTSKKWFYLGLGLASITLVISAFLLNPSPGDFKLKVRDRLLTDWQDNGEEGMKEVHELAVEMVDAAIDRMMVRSNYGVCSVYTVDFPGGELKYLGAFGWIIPLQDDQTFTNMP